MHSSWYLVGVPESLWIPWRWQESNICWKQRCLFSHLTCAAPALQLFSWAARPALLAPCGFHCCSFSLVISVYLFFHPRRSAEEHLLQPKASSFWQAVQQPFWGASDSIPSLFQSFPLLKRQSRGGRCCNASRRPGTASYLHWVAPSDWEAWLFSVQ